MTKAATRGIRRALPLAGLLACLAVPALAATAEEPFWVEARGEAYQSEVDTPKDVMGRAQRNAETKAVSAAVGTFIKSRTLVSNSQISDDLVYASVRGTIDRVEVVESVWDEQDRNLYRIKVKALVRPVYPERTEGISLKLSLSRCRLREGDPVEVFYQTNCDGFAYIFSVASDGSVTLLFPNSISRDNAVKGGKTYKFPADETQIRLKAQFLPGFKGDCATEKIKMIVTRTKEDIVSLGFREGLFQVYDAKSTGMVSDLVRRLNQLEPADWAEVAAEYVLNR